MSQKHRRGSVIPEKLERAKGKVHIIFIFGHFLLDSSLIAHIDPVGKPQRAHQHRLF